jgi:hypothetical protein
MIVLSVKAVGELAFMSKAVDTFDIGQDRLFP